MGKLKKGLSIAGWVCHGIVIAVMLLACGGKAFGFAPEQVVEELQKSGLGNQVKLIGFGGLVSAILLLIPRTMMLGAMVVSAYWGGAICLHMGHHEPYIVPAIFIMLTWVGAMLRQPASFPILDPLLMRTSDLDRLKA